MIEQYLDNGRITEGLEMFSKLLFYWPPDLWVKSRPDVFRVHYKTGVLLAITWCSRDWRHLHAIFKAGEGQVSAFLFQTL